MPLFGLIRSPHLKEQNLAHLRRCEDVERSIAGLPHCQGVTERFRLADLGKR